MQNQAENFEVDYNIIRGPKRTTPFTDDELLSEKIVIDYNTSQRSDWVQQNVDNESFMKGSQWRRQDAQALINNRQVPIADNEVTPALQLKIDTLTENQPRFAATGREDSDAEDAAFVADLMEYIADISKFNVMLKKAIYKSNVGGIGALRVKFDSNADWGKGDLYVDEIDPKGLYISPNCTDADSSTSPHIVYKQVFTAREIMMQWPDFPLSEAIPNGISDIPTTNQWEYKSQTGRIDSLIYIRYNVLDRYTRVKIQMFRVWDEESDFEARLSKKEYENFGKKTAFSIRKQGQQTKYIFKDTEVEYTKAIFLQTGGVFHTAIDPQTGEQYMRPGVADSEFSIPMSTIWIDPVEMGTLLKAGVLKYKKVLVNRIKRVLTIGRKTAENQILPIENHPIVTFMRYHSDNPYPLGDIALVRPLQEMLNKLDSLIIAHLSNTVNAKLFIQKGSQNVDQIKEILGRAGTEVIEWDNETGTPPTPLIYPQIPNAVFVERQNLIQQIQRILGSYSSQDGNMEQAPRTKGATLALMEAGSTRIRAERLDLEAAINQLATVITDYIPVVYTEKKIIRIKRPNHKGYKTVFNFEQVNPDTGAKEIINDLTVGKYDIKMVANSMMPTNREAKLDRMLQLREQGILTEANNDVLLRLTDIENVDQIIEKQDMLRQTEQALQQAQQTIKQLQGQLQSTTRENIHKSEQVQVEKTKTKLNRLVDNSRADMKVSMSRIQDYLKNMPEMQDVDSETVAQQ